MNKLYFSPVDFLYFFSKITTFVFLGFIFNNQSLQYLDKSVKYFEDLKQNEILRPDHLHIISNLRVSHLVILLGQCFVCLAKKVLHLGID